jgi:hypothetical protein
MRLPDIFDRTEPVDLELVRAELERKQINRGLGAMLNSNQKMARVVFEALAKEQDRDIRMTAACMISKAIIPEDQYGLPLSESWEMNPATQQLEKQPRKLQAIDPVLESLLNDEDEKVARVARLFQTTQLNETLSQIGARVELAESIEQTVNQGFFNIFSARM